MGSLLSNNRTPEIPDLPSPTYIQKRDASTQTGNQPRIPLKFFESTFRLHELDMISSCFFFQKNCPKPLKNLPIHEICFGVMEISSFVECFTKNAPKLKYLKKLSMHWNILSYQDLEQDSIKLQHRIQRLGNEMRKLKNLEHLVFKISRNQPKSLLTFFKTVVHTKQMKKVGFELQASKFQKDDILRITNLIQGTTNLQELSLSFKRCFLGGDAFKALFDCLDKRTSLKCLRLNFAFISNMSEEYIQRIIALISKLPQLDSMYVNMSGTEIEDRHVQNMMDVFCKKGIMKHCSVKVGSCRKVSFSMASQANRLQGFVLSK